ncbi:MULTISPECIES: 3-oxoacyl-ACP reductase FabG [Croceibacter]|jgi:3-oxoacyl-[acyl-carrier protein] reductase|uniref:Probable 3-oxoacyl-(Acyl-carrier protein) reductase n=1 Tax=Croceibacter atlanticus (strain ATCC BAA-628 / JCM 21780 / CIP 108009 / IAM 15332 / KCTC 12090 / HTCC2559) TaxID=216432 RepID=A3U6K4_CROAH|nr:MULTISPECIES: 3-oxoacyl-ACP reductase FabG [Croceibacter]EAP87871.1 probable 3-oxoacyl-(acyl-carrier protein) reductase [Croceibacter atlanticus HTCC2559]MAM22396.1 3-oxoacyl-ACP reductase FabG [Croceibacter sp.]MBG25393.1 3-oxoacyl-ACP reductase FabG [Croceibacter sp.]MBW4969899.1 3-oxoacyl-ACP reductase FabG [Croceibacter atlanticus]WSP35538.1 3-oxoacyl-ACP reductase FabG [Croceibacter atlanticus]|tara:strand:+ start:841 stop:1584 length:744 start_codon:yes stop_codon:yes gene_type:complete
MSEKTKYALVTGGSRGIGRAVCIQLAKDSDYKILINYNSNETAANETKVAVEAEGNKAELLKFDVANAESVSKSLDAWQESNPEAVIEVLVNNAGINKDGLFMWMTTQDWNSVINTSLNGFFNVTNHLIKQLLVNKYGRIINMVSVSGVKGTPGQTNYSAAKGAVVAATKALAQEVAKRNVTVNAVAPGFINTDMTSELNEKELKKLIPANRFGEAEEVAHLVSFLASRNASYITGEVININGGIYS